MYSQTELLVWWSNSFSNVQLHKGFKSNPSHLIEPLKSRQGFEFGGIWSNREKQAAGDCWLHMHLPDLIRRRTGERWINWTLAKLCRKWKKKFCPSHCSLCYYDPHMGKCGFIWPVWLSTRPKTHLIGWTFVNAPLMAGWFIKHLKQFCIKRKSFWIVI